MASVLVLGLRKEFLSLLGRTHSGEWEERSGTGEWCPTEWEGQGRIMKAEAAAAKV